jgi:uncharacterized OB-fold protein
MAQKVVNAARCKACGKLVYPTHFYCPQCGGTKFEAVPVQGSGTLLTWTRVYNLSIDFATRYITLGIVELDMGVRALGQLDIAEPVTGMRVNSRVDKVRETQGKDIHGLVFFSE